MKHIVGIEIEFYLEEDCLNLLEWFKQKYKDKFIFTMETGFSSVSKVVLKPDYTIKGGLELNLPPLYIGDLEDICAYFSTLNVRFTEKCAMHIHYDAKDIDLGKTYCRYLEQEKHIVEEAKAKGLCSNLNESISSPRAATETRYVNLNIWKAFLAHRTIEHRIYKATFNYEDIVWCISQLDDVIVYTR